MSVSLQLGTSSIKLDPVQKNRVFAGRDPTACFVPRSPKGLVCYLCKRLGRIVFVTGLVRG